MEISMTLDQRLLFDKEFTKKDFLRLTGKALLLALTIISLSSINVLATPKVATPMMNESTAWTILKVNEVINHKHMMKPVITEGIKEVVDVTKYLIELTIEAFKNETNATLLLSILRR